MKKEIIYIADIDQDIDDIIAAEYLNIQGNLKGIVLDPEPKTNEGKQRVEELKKMGIVFFDKIPQCDAIFVGGAFSKLSSYLILNKVDCIVANGGFVGSNIISEDKQLEKFKNKKYVRTFNFNIDVSSTISVLNSKNVNKIYLIGKNVCHSIKNTTSGIWKDEQFLKKYNLKPEKRLHDLLMVKEGLMIINNKSLLLNYENINPIYEKIDGSFTKWGSEKGNKAIASTTWK